MKLRLALFFCFLCNYLGAQTTITYLSSSEDFPNPERGFYYPSTTGTGGAYNSLNAGTIANLRNLYSPWQATYQVHSTLIYRYFMLDQFVNTNISAAYLTNMSNDFAALRTAGAKIIVRFAYTVTEVPAPYGDASKSQVLQHIQQLSSVLQDNADVIAAVQMGFIGIWGEQYYTDHFGDASTTGSLSAANWADRNEVLSALLNAVPSSRMVQVRYPQIKQKFLYGTSAETDPLNSLPVSQVEAYSGTNIARIGFHNDCFLASNTDFGTFTNYDPWSAAHSTMTPELRDYKGQDADFVVVGGETCSANVDVTDDEMCDASGGRADTDMALFNYSYLNSDYNNLAVNNSWDGVCLDDIKLKLGYRFSLQSGIYTTSAQPGQTININLNIENEGWAAPFNPRLPVFVLRNTSTNQLYFASSTNDPRTWAAGNSTNINETFCLPADMPIGSYELLLHLPDPEISLYDRSEYAIRLAAKLPDNSDVWENATGYNKLGHTLVVDNVSAGNICEAETVFSIHSPLPVEWLFVKAEPYQGSAIRCHWAVTQLENHARFLVERSQIGQSWTTLGEVLANTNSEETAFFEWIDRDVITGVTYFYRIIQEDFDGTSHVSSITHAIIADFSPSFIISPNPSKGVVRFQSEYLETGEIFIYNSLGQLVEQFEVNQLVVTKNLSHLESGAYWVRFGGEWQTLIIN